MIAKFDPTHALSYGYWICPKCKSQFYGGGKAMHNPGCPETGYGNCIYAFGPNESLYFAPSALKKEIESMLSETLPAQSQSQGDEPT